MNLGQFLLANSPLPSATVAQHIASLHIGKTVFTSQFAVALETPRVEISRKKRPVQDEAVQHQPASSRSKDLKALYCTVAGDRLDTSVATEEMTIRITHQRTLFVHKAERKQYTKKGSK